MKIKRGVILYPLRNEMRRGLRTIERIYKQFGYELTITSGLEGEHSAGSYHYIGCAVDCRVRNVKKKDRGPLFTALQLALRDPFDVVMHKSHIHIEFDLDKAARLVL